MRDYTQAGCDKGKGGIGTPNPSGASAAQMYTHNTCTHIYTCSTQEATRRYMYISGEGEQTYARSPSVVVPPRTSQRPDEQVLHGR